MSLTHGHIRIERLEFGPRTMLRDTTLLFDADGLCRALRREDPRIRDVRAHLVRPGESARILCVKDVLMPWCKVSGAAAGEGVTHVLPQVAVVTCGRIVGFQEGVIDMRGPGARYSPFSQTLNIVLELEVIPGLSPHQHEEVVRGAGVRAAALVGEAAREARPEREEVFAEPVAADPALPRVAYLYLLLSQGLLHDTYVFGRNAREGLPRVVPPPLLLDYPAIVSGNCVSACDKNTTWHHQNNPVPRELFRRHGKDLHFAGVVLSNEPVRLAAKEASAAAAVALVLGLGAQGVILTKEGFGNPDADQMMLTRGLEQAGVHTVSITDEYAGQDGLSQSLADVTPEADAVVSTGNANERVLLPAMERLIGPTGDLTSLAGASSQSPREDGGIEIELQTIIGATNELGAGTLRAREV